MDSHLQRPASSRPLVSTIGILDSSSGLNTDLGPFNPANPFATSFRPTGSDPPSSHPPHAPQLHHSSQLQHDAQQQLRHDSHLQHARQLQHVPQLQNSPQAHPSQLQQTSQIANPIVLGDSTSQAPGSGLDSLQTPYTAFTHHDYAALASNAPDASGFAGQLEGMKLVPEPPDLDLWRNKLFNVDEMITLSEEQFQIYFPHVDNVYSHRSTQRYKRRPFVSHYWDCRLKGRPPGTPKSNDPNKKKRKRTVRERDLCDVKIKITEYFPTAESLEGTGEFEPLPTAELLPGVQTLFPLQGDHGFGVLTPPSNLPEGHPGANGGRYFTIQRVNGNSVNGKNDITEGHRHTLEESDRVKKNSVQRYLLKEDKERKKNPPISTSSRNSDAFAQYHNMADTSQQKTYHTKATGVAFATVARHSADSNLKLYGSCFCPFVQRVWIALEMKGIPYQYIEVDPYKKPASLLEVNPRGLVPALRHDDWGCYESTVLLEYLEDLKQGVALLPEDPKLRAHCRLWGDHINRHIVPCFYRVLQEQSQEKQIANAQELRNAFDLLIAAAHPHGPFFLGSELSIVDVQAAPWVIRLRRVLKPYRGWPDAEEGSRFASWVNAIDAHEHVRATTSTDQLYIDSYERYARECLSFTGFKDFANIGHS
ncbi:hypothetical protein N7462_007710 [Penicillium macrosclerotiorum]|uniref:uncharacterized protein n=1 Tax=Penicillium macrosclerotiorum TaxID=303699 RepID=UPI002549BE64|nr:uncharacterized protein N7462_007710 [Penicillium macrosclerotiorum]KAJ5679466.1 hypothetical protein N7462_007710 [Penicillium macrosclerotiorum]